MWTARFSYIHPKRSLAHLAELVDLGSSETSGDTGRNSGRRCGGTRFKATARAPSSPAQSMIDLAGAYDPAIPPSENQTCIEAVREIRGPRQEALGRELASIRDGVKAEEG